MKEEVFDGADAFVIEGLRALGPIPAIDAMGVFNVSGFMDSATDEPAAIANYSVRNSR
jgi:hypothetical protein